MSDVAHLQDFQVVELRRYTIVDGQRERFACYFESWFAEAFEQLGAIACGQFLERRKPLYFTWLRGYRDLDTRATVNAAFYFGPLWKEHRTRMNGLLIDSDDVLLLRPLSPAHGIPVLPAVDPVDEVAGGIVVAQIFAVRAGAVESLAGQAEPFFARYRAAGTRDAGLLATLDAPNNFPLHPIRTDGPFLVWLGVLEDERALREGWEPLAGEAARALGATGLLRGEPELVVLDPARRSRLRWLPAAGT